MGRLTLSVLLSFAQFERELASERIRDKFAVSRRKGIGASQTDCTPTRRRRHLQSGARKLLHRYLAGQRLALAEFLFLCSVLNRDLGGGLRGKSLKHFRGTEISRVSAFMKAEAARWAPVLDEVGDTPILKTGRFPRYPPSLPWVNGSGRATAATVAKRFSAMARLGRLYRLR